LALFSAMSPTGGIGSNAGSWPLLFVSKLALFGAIVPSGGTRAPYQPTPFPVGGGQLALFSANARRRDTEGT
jgi:hypothetical protein